MSEKRTFTTALITGISGSGGSYMADHIATSCPEVGLHGLARWHTHAPTNLEGPGARAIVHECDLNDLGSIIRVLDKVRPDVIFHLASHANVRASFDVPLAVLQNNILATANLFEAIRIIRLDPIIQLCSTSEVYGLVEPHQVPITEDCPLRPVSPYAVSKAAQDLLGFGYFKSFGLKIIRTRMFAYFNPRRADLFATSFARQVARIEAGLQEELLHGNLDSTRTMIDVRDAMSSYWIAAQACEPGEVYNIGGVTVITVGQFLEAICRMSDKPIRTRLNPNLLRPVDVTLQIPSVEKFRRSTGWQPRYSFQDSVEHLLQYWRQRISSSPKNL
jgi:GDP-4-dehydro-6-deoxy-D-mannose reductase